MAHLPANRRSEPPLVESVKTYAASQHTPIKFERITTVERQQIAVKAADVRSLRDQRSQWEASPAPTVKTGTPTRPQPPQTAARPVTKPAREARPPAVVAPHPVRVAQPERVAVPTLPRTAQPAESRFIAKQPPSHPVQEQSHVASSPFPKSSSRDSQARPNPTGSPNKDRER